MIETKVKRIAIAGSHSCGKTSLVHELSKELVGYPVVEEVASLFPREIRSCMETQCAIMRLQIDKERRCRPLMLSDRTVMDNSAYTFLCYDEGSRTDNDIALLKMNEERFGKHMMGKPYDLVIFVDELLPIEDNNSRCLNPYYQTLIFNNLRVIIDNVYKRYGGFDVLNVKGIMDERMESIKSYLIEH